MKTITISKEQKVILEKVEVARSFSARLKGLLGRDELEDGAGMLLVPCGSIHCMGMKFTIDAIFMDVNKRVIGLKGNLKPGSGTSVYGAHYCLEVREGFIMEQGILIGDTLEFEI